MKCMIKREKKDHTRWRTQGLGQKSSGQGEEVEWGVFGREKRVFLSREIREKWEKNRVETIYRKIKHDGSRAIENLSSTNSWQINLLKCCRETVDSQRTSMDRTAIEQTEIFSMDREFVEKLLRQVLESFNGSRLH